MLDENNRNELPDNVIDQINSIGCTSFPITYELLRSMGLLSEELETASKNPMSTGYVWLDHAYGII